LAATNSELEARGYVSVTRQTNGEPGDADRRTSAKRLLRKLLIANTVLGGLIGYFIGGLALAIVGALVLGAGVGLGAWYYFALVFR
jgi:hypothetical protein